jgi:hypothetical protein
VKFIDQTGRSQAWGINSTISCAALHIERVRTSGALQEWQHV